MHRERSRGRGTRSPGDTREATGPSIGGSERQEEEEEEKSTVATSVMVSMSILGEVEVRGSSSAGAVEGCLDRMPWSEQERLPTANMACARMVACVGPVPSRVSVVGMYKYVV